MTQRLDIMVSQNKIHVFESGFKESDLRDSKITEGYDPEIGDIKIVDKDYGKSAELMRYIMEGGESRGIGLLPIFIGIFAIILIVMILFFLLSGGDSEQQPQIREIVEIQNLPEPIEQNILPEPVDITEPVYIDNGQSFELQRLAYEVSIANSEKTRLQQEINLLNSEHSQELQKLKVENENLKQINKSLENDLNLYSGGEFYYHLGLEVFQRCENFTDEDKIDNCEKLFYNYLKNDTVN